MNPQAIRFLLNGHPVQVDDEPPTRTVLAWLRQRRGLTGTKEGCAEGDCGACTVVVGEAVAGAQGMPHLRLRTQNACIQFLPTLHGKALFTVEYLREQTGGTLHPVQQALVAQHGSQCGFCTPGFVMSLWQLYHRPGPQTDHPHHPAASAAVAPDHLDDATVRSALTGNLCRCTGYRPILDAGRTMFDLPHQVLDEAGLLRALGALSADTDDVQYRHSEGAFFAPRELATALRLRAEHPRATVLAGGTDIGLWVNKQFRDLGDILYLGRLDALKRVTVTDAGLHIGAAASLTDAYAALARHYPTLSMLWERFASPPVRNAGTLGGNLANGSPIGDSAPALIALGAEVVLASVRGERRLPLTHFYLDYMKKDLGADELLSAVVVPLPTPAQRFRLYKVSKRFDSDISAVCAAFAITLDDDGRIGDARIAFGGMAATSRRAPAAEAALCGQPWNEATLQRAQHALANDYAPLNDLRASAAYRQRVAANLLRRFYLETRPDAPWPAEAVTAFAGLAASGA